MALLAVIGFSLPAAAQAIHVANPAAAATASISSGPTSAAPVSPTGSAPVASPTAAIASQPTPQGDGHEGTLNVNEIAPEGALGIDPAIAYDTVSSEPVENLYETLVAYQGSSTSSFDPVVATCVPGTVQCGQDYPGAAGTNLVANGATTSPEYWTYVIDPAAHFANGQAVWPTDVMYSIARDLVYSNPEVYTPAWIVGQALLPAGNPLWDPTGLGPVHAPLNSTPADILSSMLINDSTYCPAKAMDLVHGDGCITFIADAGAVPWPYFNDYVADNLGASITSCDWTSIYGDGALPGWYAPPSGMGTCVLPNYPGSGSTTAYTSTNAATNPTWASYLTGLASGVPQSTCTPGMSGAGNCNVTAWDGVWANEYNVYPYDYAFSGGTQAMGSGPYMLSGSSCLKTGMVCSMASETGPTSGPFSSGTMTTTAGYLLTANPYYTQPSACSGANGIKVYTVYCYPESNGIPYDGGYVYNVSVIYQEASPDPASGTYSEYTSGYLDFAGFLQSDANYFLEGKAAGILNYNSAASLSDFFIPFNLDFNTGQYTDDGNGPAPAFGGLFLTNIAARNFFVQSFPFGTAFSSGVYTEDGLVYQIAAGGPIPYTMGGSPGTAQSVAGYYPLNVTFPGNVNPVTDSATNPCSASEYTACSAQYGTWAYWWAQLNNPLSPNYDAGLSACTVGSPCPIALDSEAGATSLTAALYDWAALIDADSGGRLAANVVTTLTFDDLIADGIGGGGPGAGGLAIWNLGWAPDFPLPIDYLGAEVLPDGDFTYTDSVAEQLTASEVPGSCLTAYEGTTWKDLIYWAHNTQVITTQCQGYAYAAAVYWSDAATSMTSLTQQKITYDLATMIYNALSLYVWQGQSNVIPGFAPWINSASLNYNPMIGGGGDQFWFKIQYNVFTGVTFTQSGLPKYSVWTPGVAGITSATQQMTVGFTSSSYQTAGTTETLQLPRGVNTITPQVVTQSYIGQPPAATDYNGYGLVSSTLPSTLTVTAVSPPTDTLTFAWNGAANLTAHGLPPGTTLNVKYVSSAGTLGPAPTYASTSTYGYGGNYYLNTSLSPNAVGKYYTTTISVPNGYAICAASTTAFVTPTGTQHCSNLGMPVAPVPPGTITTAGTYHATIANDTVLTLNVWFHPVYEVFTFIETGLPAGAGWTVNMTNFTYTTYEPGFTSWSGGVYDAVTVQAPAHIVIYLPQNVTAVFGYTVNMYYAVSSYVPSISSGYVLLNAAHTIAITAIDPAKHHITLYGPEMRGDD